MTMLWSLVTIWWSGQQQIISHFLLNQSLCQPPPTPHSVFTLQYLLQTSFLQHSRSSYPPLDVIMIAITSIVHTSSAQLSHTRTTRVSAPTDCSCLCLPSSLFSHIILSSIIGSGAASNCDVSTKIGKLHDKGYPHDDSGLHHQPINSKDFKHF